MTEEVEVVNLETIIHRRKVAVAAAKERQRQEYDLQQRTDILERLQTGLTNEEYLVVQQHLEVNGSGFKFVWHGYEYRMHIGLVESRRERLVYIRLGGGNSPVDCIENGADFLEWLGER